MTGAASLEQLLGLVLRAEIKALSIKQPYPHHIFHNDKDVENRNWPTRRRGWFLIHAGVSTSEMDKNDHMEMTYPRGGIVGAAQIADCVTDMESAWFFGDYGFVLRDAIDLPLAPCRGQLGFFVPPPAALTIVATGLSALIGNVDQSETENAGGVADGADS